MLEAVFLGARQAVHDPFGPFVEIGQPPGVGAFRVQAGQRQEGSDRGDVLGGRAGREPVAKPVEHDLPATRIASLLVVLVDSVQANAMGPFPVVPALGVDHAAVVQAQQELARAVLDLDQVADQQLDLAIDFGGHEVSGLQSRWNIRNA